MGGSRGWKGIWGPCPFLSLFLLPTAMRSVAFPTTRSHHDVLLLHSQPWTGTFETVSQDKPFLLFKLFLGYFVTAMES
jgi:hypothetical protein